MNFTQAQQDAIAAEGDTLVIAGAGTGKTRTLVERCVRRLLDRKLDIGLDQILVVTFTEVAAAEIRQRVRQRLEEELQRDPNQDRLQAQLAALDMAHISTLHSFCLDLVRQHFHELEIDPQITVLAEEQAIFLAEETLDALLSRHYEGTTEAAKAVREYLSDHAQGWDARLKGLLLEIHHFTQTRPDPEGWFQRQFEALDQSEPDSWRDWLLAGFRGWRQSWQPILALLAQNNETVGAIQRALEGVALDPMPAASGTPPSPDAKTPQDWVERIRAGLEAVRVADATFVKGEKTRFRKPLEPFLKEAAFLESQCPKPGSAEPEPLREDWNWVRPPLRLVVGLARDFAKEYAEAKRERGAVDFHDLEQFALRLLWDAGRQEPTDLARAWQQKLKLIFVDEYQDINQAQDTILTALSRPGPAANRFLVGDVKQSIYRFRQAAPQIFQDYAKRWNGSQGQGRALFLTDNFRSREGLLHFVNAVFPGLMRQDLGGVDYDAQAALQFGNPGERQPLSRDADPASRVELHLWLKGDTSGAEDSDENGGSSASADTESAETDLEARLVARRLKALHDTAYPIWDPDAKISRPVTWKDMVVLLRSPRTRVDNYAKAFARLGVPLQAKRAGFFDSIEIHDLLNLLTLLDNPLQDVPTVAVLRSPMAGLTLEELARIRIPNSQVPFWTALRHWHQQPQSPSTQPALFSKVDAFLSRFDHWRVQARHASLSQRLEMILRDTAYADWLLCQPRGEQRRGNVARLLVLAREFDELATQGLHRFLAMIEAEKENQLDREPAPLATGDAVQLMSIHQSKGLEFPVVVVADLGRQLNLSEATQGIILDERYGLCPTVRPTDGGQHYASLPFWLAERRLRAEALGEELRILYVAFTRAQDTLILAGTASAQAAQEKWPALNLPAPPLRQLLQARAYLDWLGPWFTRTAGMNDWTQQLQGQAALWTWQIHSDLELAREGQESGDRDQEAGVRRQEEVDGGRLEAMRRRAFWTYPFVPATRVPAKSSVTALRRLALAADEESRPAPFLRGETIRSGWREEVTSAPRELSPSEVGQAHHTFLQYVELSATGTEAGLRSEAQRLVGVRLLSEPESGVLDFEGMAAFWNSATGLVIREHSGRVRREWPFTCRLTARDVAALSRAPGLNSSEASESEVGAAAAPDRVMDRAIPEGEFVVVQGVADLVVLLDQEIWLLDFKTDHFQAEALEAKIRQYEPQLGLYRLALERIVGRPVTRTWLHFLAIRTTRELVSPRHECSR